MAIDASVQNNGGFLPARYDTENPMLLPSIGEPV